MRILLTNSSPVGSGSFSAILGLTQELEKLKHNVKILFPDNNHHNKDHKNYDIWQFPIKKNNLCIDRVPSIIPGPNTFSDLSSAQLKLYFAELERKITNVIQQFKPDIIECHHVWIMDYIISRMGIPFVSVAHNSDQNGFYDHPQIQKYAKLAAQKAKYIFAVSGQVKQKVIKCYDVDPNKVIVCDNAYDKDIYRAKIVDPEAVYQKFNLPLDAYIVIFVGKVSKEKGIDILLQAGQLIDLRKNIHFVLVGDGSIEKVLQDLGLGQNKLNFDRVHVLGHQSAEVLVDLYSIAKIKVMPSRSEGFSIACLEAMGSGLPVVASHQANMQDVIIGEIYDTNDPRKLAVAIEKIHALSEKQYQILKQQAYDKANTYSWETIAKARLPYYDDAKIYY